MYKQKDKRVIADGRENKISMTDVIALLNLYKKIKFISERDIFYDY